LFNLFTFTGLLIDEALPSSIEVLDLQLFNAVLGHLSLDVFALYFTVLAVLFQDGTTSIV
jgi:hypothetical protein